MTSAAGGFWQSGLTAELRENHNLTAIAVKKHSVTAIAISSKPNGRTSVPSGKGGIS
jgi:hypothetical protein